MTISPREAAKRTDQAIANEVAAAEDRLDRMLSSRYSSGRRVEIDGRDLPRDHLVRDELLKRYKHAGWKIEHYTGDQREPADCYIFSAKRSDAL